MKSLSDSPWIAWVVNRTLAIVVADLEIRVVVLNVATCASAFTKAHRAVEVFERELTANRASVSGELPVARELFEQLSRIRCG